MDQGMQEYLKKVAIQTKIENYKEFDKTKEETILAIRKSFGLDQNQAEKMVKEIWKQDFMQITSKASVSLLERREQLVQERDQKLQEYEQAIQIVEDALNGYSPERIAKQKGVSLQVVYRLLG